MFPQSVMLLRRFVKGVAARTKSGQYTSFSTLTRAQHYAKYKYALFSKDMATRINNGQSASFSTLARAQMYAKYMFSPGISTRINNGQSASFSTLARAMQNSAKYIGVSVIVGVSLITWVIFHPIPDSDNLEPDIKSIKDPKDTINTQQTSEPGKPETGPPPQNGENQEESDKEKWMKKVRKENTNRPQKIVAPFPSNGDQSSADHTTDPTKEIPHNPPNDPGTLTYQPSSDSDPREAANADTISQEDDKDGQKITDDPEQSDRGYTDPRKNDQGYTDPDNESSQRDIEQTVHDPDHPSQDQKDHEHSSLDPDCASSDANLDQNGEESLDQKEKLKDEFERLYPPAPSKVDPSDLTDRQKNDTSTRRGKHEEEKEREKKHKKKTRVEEDKYESEKHEHYRLERMEHGHARDEDEMKDERKQSPRDEKDERKPSPRDEKDKRKQSPRDEKDKRKPSPRDEHDKWKPSPRDRMKTRGQPRQATWIFSESTMKDERITSILGNLLPMVESKAERSNLRFHWTSRPGRECTWSRGSMLVVPCIVASRVGSDIEAAVNGAQFSKSEQFLQVLFHHKAPHNSKVFPTREKSLSDQDIQSRCVDIIDVVFWNGTIYDCPQNAKALEEIKHHLEQIAI